jgi:hypothetical protein
MRSIRLAVPLVLAATVPLSAQTASVSPPRRHQSVLHVLTFTVGGVIIGGWAGYVTAQIVRSDWQDPTGRTAQRLRFSAGGAALGLVAGVLLGTRGSRAAAAPQPPRLPLPINRPITAQEIRASSARTLTELVRELRPQWLRARGQAVIPVLDPNTGVHAANGVVVYLNGTPFGDLTSLDEVPIEEVTSIQFLDGPAAVLRYGTGNEDGAILLSTAAGP